MTFLNTMLGNLLDLFFPIYCISCNKSGSYLCIHCLSDAPGAEREGVPWVYPLFDYRHPPIKKSLWLLKYKNKKKMSRIFAEVLHGKIIEELSELSYMENFREPLLVPIPLSKKRYRERGYNQAELIAKELANIDAGVNFTLENNILIKIKDVEHQARIRNRNERLKNIVGSFAVKDGHEIINKRNIILIDDILTTGATLSEAKKVLKEAGARKVIAFTVAH